VFLRKLRCSRLSYANVVSSLALALAVGGGTAVAATSLSYHQVTGAKLAPNAVTPSKVKNSSLSGTDLRDSSLTTNDIRNGSLLAADFAANQLPQGPKGEPGVAISGTVSSGGSLVVAKNVTGVALAGAGVYTATFGQDVSKCSAVATVGGFKVGDNTQDAPDGGTVTLQPNGATQITFTTRATNGTITNLPFHFAVSC
jgi:uncharacterized protein YjbI with pentapeptide repeats